MNFSYQYRICKKNQIISNNRILQSIATKILGRKQTLAPARWTKKPLRENPINALIEELSPHKLCISPAREGWLMVCCVTQASIATSAIAIPALPATRDNKANARCKLLWSDRTSMEITPSNPGIMVNKYVKNLHWSYNKVVNFLSLLLFLCPFFTLGVVFMSEYRKKGEGVHDISSENNAKQCYQWCKPANKTLIPNTKNVKEQKY